MSNRAYLVRTKFEGDDNETGWGWRMGDDHFRSYTDYCNEHEVPKTPLELLAKAAAEATEDERGLFEDMIKSGKGISIRLWHPTRDPPALRNAWGGLNHGRCMQHGGHRALHAIDSAKATQEIGVLRTPSWT